MSVNMTRATLFTSCRSGSRCGSSAHGKRSWLLLLNQGELVGIDHWYLRLHVLELSHSPFTGYQPQAQPSLRWAHARTSPSASWSTCPTTSRWTVANGSEPPKSEEMSQQPQSSSNETNFSFAPAAPAQAINDTPGSAESGGGGTVSYRAPGSGASSNSFTMVSQTGSLRGSANRSTSARSPRSGRAPTAATKDASGRGPSGAATREDEVSKSATSSKRKSSGSAARNESETRLRRQLQHNIEKLERSEQARTELESRLNLYQGALTLRDQMINNVEVYSHQHHEEYQEHVNSEMEYMRSSLIPDMHFNSKTPR